MKRHSLARLSLILAAASMLALSTGCGSDDDGDGGGGGGSSPRAENEAAIKGAEKSAATESDVLAALGATKDDLNSDEFSAPGASDPCGISVVMTTAEQVALYRDAGDTVVTNPDATAGVKLFVTTADAAACLKAAEKALRDL